MGRTSSSRPLSRPQVCACRSSSRSLHAVVLLHWHTRRLGRPQLRTIRISLDADCDTYHLTRRKRMKVARDRITLTPPRVICSLLWRPSSHPFKARTRTFPLRSHGLRSSPFGLTTLRGEEHLQIAEGFCSRERDQAYMSMRVWKDSFLPTCRAATQDA